MSAIFSLSEFREFDPAGLRNCLLRGCPGQPVGKFDFRSGSRPCRAEFRKRCAEHGRAYRAPRRAVQPVVVAAFRLQFPFIHPPAAPLGLHPVFGGEVFREHLVDAGDSAIERKVISRKNLDSAFEGTKLAD